MKVGIIGYGSAGKRHERILSSMNHEIAVVSRRETGHATSFKTVSELIKEYSPEMVIVANETSAHGQVLKELNDNQFSGAVIVEKPLLSNSEPISSHQFSHSIVYYNLRFHPLIQTVKKQLKGEKILSALFYVGQYLPTWRATDYRDSYSSRKEEGGGALRDLSHELDYALFLLGNASDVCAQGGHFSSLEITSDDVYSLKLKTEKCPVVDIQVNYLDRNHQRFFSINTDTKTFTANLLTSELTINGKTEKLDYHKDWTHIEFFKEFFQGKKDNFCDFRQGLQVVELVVKAEESAKLNKWIKL